jgi:hypothetical protein
VGRILRGRELAQVPGQPFSRHTVPSPRHFSSAERYDVSVGIISSHVVYIVAQRLEGVKNGGQKLSECAVRRISRFTQVGTSTFQHRSTITEPQHTTHRRVS